MKKPPARGGCMHPDSDGIEDHEFLAGNIFSKEDCICQLCGGMCKGLEVSSPELHVLHKDFLYCPEKDKTKRMHAVEVEICPLCGKIVSDTEIMKIGTLPSRTFLLGENENAIGYSGA